MTSAKNIGKDPKSPDDHIGLRCDPHAEMFASHWVHKVDVLLWQKEIIFSWKVRPPSWTRPALAQRGDRLLVEEEGLLFV